MDGLVNLYKPLGLTSARAVSCVRAITGERKSGHAGSLDPLAEGVLVVCLGRATRLVEALMGQPKVYRTTARLDVTNDCFDAEHPLIPVSVADPPSADRVRSVLAGFQGRIEQTPPPTSAVKVGGRPAYRFARSGQAVELAPRSVEIHWVHVHSYAWPLLDFEVACGRGTYIRALVRDIATRLDTGGCITKLTRLAVGPLRRDQSWTLERLEAAADPGQYLIPLDRARELLAQQPVPVPERPRS